jgi:hypothetical protein
VIGGVFLAKREGVPDPGERDELTGERLYSPSNLERLPPPVTAEPVSSASTSSAKAEPDAGGAAA